MTQLAVTVVGQDRPGIIADVTAALAALGGNVEDSSMTLLRGHFAMTLILAVPSGVAAVTEALRPVTADGTLTARVEEVADVTGPTAERASSAFLMTVHGADHPGIVAATTRVLAEAGGNITDLATRLSSSGLYVLTVEVQLPDDRADAVVGRLTEVATELGVRASLRPLEADVL